MRTWQGIDAIEDIRTVPLRRWMRPLLWLSSARLNSRFDGSFGGRFAVPTRGVGWGADRAEAESVSRSNASLLQAIRCLKSEQSLGDDGFGYALLPGTAESGSLRREAVLRSLGTWCLDRIERRRASGLVCFPGQLIATLPERHLFSDRRKNLKLFSTRIEFNADQPDPFHVAVASIPSQEGGVVFASAAAHSQGQAAIHALRRLYLRRRRLERFILGHEQILDRIADQRLFAFGISDTLARKFHNRIRRSINQGSPNIFTESPTIKEFEVIEGPWSSHYRLARIDYDDLQSPSRGGLERMVD